MDQYRSTVLSQYANSPKIGALIDDFDAWIRPDVDLDNVYSFIWNVKTASGFGLDILGRIVNISRNINIPGSNTNFGFKDARPTSYPFGQQPFYNGTTPTTVYPLSDSAYRTLILAKAMINISNTTAQNVNAMLQVMFPGRGNCYVVDQGGMAIKYVFEFALMPWEQAILNSSFFQHPAGVLTSIQILTSNAKFGFQEAGYSPFGVGNFY